MKKVFAKRLFAILIIAMLNIASAKAYAPPPATNFFIINKLRKPTISVTLAPLLKPSFVKFSSYGAFPITGDNGQFTFDAGKNIILYWTKITDADNSSSYDDYYNIKIQGMKIDDPSTADFRISFAQIANDQINKTKDWLKVGSNNSKTTTYIGNSDCNARSTSEVNLCLLSTSYGFVPEAQSISRQTIQKIPLGGVFVEGNVGGVISVGNLHVDPNALVVGGNILPSIESGNQIKNYLNTSNLNLTTDFINQLFKKAQGVGSVPNLPPRTGFTEYNLTGSVNLNSEKSNLTSSDSTTTFSSPPEGKLWYFKKAPVGSTSITISNAQIHGSGTIVAEPGITVNIGPGVTCDPDTRFGFIAQPLNSPNGFNIFPESGDGNGIYCGAYINADTGNRGQIIFHAPSNPNQDTNIKGMFITSGSISVPLEKDLTSPYYINYDSYFAAHPTALFQDVLKFVNQ